MMITKLNFVPAYQVKTNNVATEINPDDLMPEKTIIDKNSI
jgi:hypothetical protein